MESVGKCFPTMGLGNSWVYCRSSKGSYIFYYAKQSPITGFTQTWPPTQIPLNCFFVFILMFFNSQMMIICLKGTSNSTNRFYCSQRQGAVAEWIRRSTQDWMVPSSNPTNSVFCLLDCFKLINWFWFVSHNQAVDPGFGLCLARQQER